MEVSLRLHFFFLLMTNYLRHIIQKNPTAPKKKKTVVFGRQTNVEQFFELNFLAHILNCSFEPFQMNSKALFDTSSLIIGTNK